VGDGREKWIYLVLMLLLEVVRMSVSGVCSKTPQKGTEAARVAWVVKRRARAGRCILGSCGGGVGCQLMLSLEGESALRNGM